MILTLDTENTTWNRGNAFDQRNFNVCISYKVNDEPARVCFEDRSDFSRVFHAASTLVGFNLKYDLHWLRKLGFELAGKKVWCGMVGHFTQNRQSRRFPSMNEVAEFHGFGAKIDVVQTEYWDKGINTHEIPVPVLTEYALQDAELTYKIYKKQQELLKPSQQTLLSLLMQDLLVLEEMEWNGLHYDKEESLKRAKEIEAEILSTQAQFELYHSVPNFNWASPQHLSALLYGGTILQKKKVPVGIYKSGKQKGEVRYGIEVVEHHLPRRYKPIRGSELAKEGQYSTDEAYLRMLHGDRKLIDGILKIKGMQKLMGTYFMGMPALHEEMNWEEGYLHGEFNQVVAATGRLSSSKPNLQNLDERAQVVFTSRYDN